MVKFRSLIYKMINTAKRCVGVKEKLRHQTKK